MRLAVTLIAMGITIEYLQRATGYRTFEYADMLANTAGVTLGLILSSTSMGKLYPVFERYFNSIMNLPE